MIIGWANIFRKHAAADDAVEENTRATAGFTLVETLAAMVVVVLLTGIVAMGMSAGLTIYEKTMFSSESGALASTIDSALAGPVRLASYNAPADKYTVSYRGIGGHSAVLSVSDGQIYLGFETDADSFGNKIVPTPLLNESAYTDCKVSDISLTRIGTVFNLTYTITDSKGGLSKTYGTDPEHPSNTPIQYQPYQSS